MRRRALTAAILVLLGGVRGTFAQSEESPVEKIRDYIDRLGILDRLNPEEGIYPRLEGLPTGSGLTGGVGYRSKHWLFPFDVSGMVSTRYYKLAEATVRLASVAGDRVQVWTTAKWQEFPQEDFYGLGLGSRLETRTDYGIRSTDLSARLLVKPLRWLTVGTDVGRFEPTIYPGTDDEFPSIERLFSDQDAPGLARQPLYGYTSVFVDTDFRDVPGNPHRGGRWLASFSNWNDRTLQQFDYRRFDLDASHFVPLAPERHVLAIHTSLAYVNNAPGQRVPFYAFPFVGGHDTLRGFQDFRFRDENALLLNVEYRYDLISFIELAGFVDAGEVRHNWEEIGLSGLKHSYGGGVRVKTSNRVFARLDVGTGGGEGTQVFFKFGRSF